MCWPCWSACVRRATMSKRLATLLSQISADTMATSTSSSPKSPTSAATNPTQLPLEPLSFKDGLGDPNCPHCHGLGYLREDVPPGHPNFGRLTPCVCQIDSMSAVQAETVRMAFERSRIFAENPKQWMLLTGTYGSGKTHLAAAIANHCLANGQPVL